MSFVSVDFSAMQIPVGSSAARLLPSLVATWSLCSGKQKADIFGLRFTLMCRGMEAAQDKEADNIIRTDFGE